MSSNGAKGCFPVENTIPAIPFSPYVLYVKRFDLAPLKRPKMSHVCGENHIGFLTEHAC